MKTYKIIRFEFNGNPRVIKRGLSLEQAQTHCKREDTHGEGWFDGYEEESKYGRNTKNSTPSSAMLSHVGANQLPRKRSESKTAS
jgi:hypothetical protein